MNYYQFATEWYDDGQYFYSSGIVAARTFAEATENIEKYYGEGLEQYHLQYLSEDLLVLDNVETAKSKNGTFKEYLIKTDTIDYQDY